MKKIKKYSLDDIEEESNEWIGICTSHSDYRLVWGLNQALNSQLARQDENYKVSKKGVFHSEHSFYFWFEEESLASYYLLKNKYEGKYLIPEKPQIDYFLVLKESSHLDLERIIEQIKSVNSVMAAFSFEEKALPSADGLIFDY